MFECMLLAGTVYLVGDQELRLGVLIEPHENIIYELSETSVSVDTTENTHVVTLRDNDSEDIVYLSRYDPMFPEFFTKTQFYDFSLPRILTDCE